jgi:hypothetical protein
MVKKILTISLALLCYTNLRSSEKEKIKKIYLLNSLINNDSFNLNTYLYPDNILDANMMIDTTKKQLFIDKKYTLLKVISNCIDLPSEIDSNNYTFYYIGNIKDYRLIYFQKKNLEKHDIEKRIFIFKFNSQKNLERVFQVSYYVNYMGFSSHLYSIISNKKLIVFEKPPNDIISNGLKKKDNYIGKIRIE